MTEQKKPVVGSRLLRDPKPVGLAAQYYLEADGTVGGVVVIDESKEGPPGHAHGGALAMLVDEAMGMAAWYQGHRVVAVNLNINYRHAVPLNQPVTVTGKVDRLDGRKAFGVGKVILPDGTVAVEATGIFVEAPQYVGEDKFAPKDQSDESV